MSKRSSAFKRSLIDQAKSEILDDMKMRSDYSNDFKNSNYLEKLANLLGVSLKTLLCFINNSIKSKNNSYYIISKDEYDKLHRSLSEAYNEGEKKEHERHLKAEDEAFKRGKKYGAEQRENELRAKYKFIEKTINKDDSFKSESNDQKIPYNNCKKEDKIYINEFPYFDGFNSAWEAFSEAFKHFKI